MSEGEVGLATFKYIIELFSTSNVNKIDSVKTDFNDIVGESLSITNFEGHGLVIMSKGHLFTVNIYQGNTTLGRLGLLFTPPFGLAMVLLGREPELEEKQAFKISLDTPHVPEELELVRRSCFDYFLGFEWEENRSRE
ncbi:hypothetical protein Tco_1335469 [Tanacetum coccineum]